MDKPDERFDMPNTTAPERFWSKVDVGQRDECWLWTAHTAGGGYGYYRPGGKAPMVPAHRVAYELLIGPIPDGLQLDHLCRVRACVNPDHLEAVTQTVNVLRGFSPSAEASRKIYCVRGHDLTDPANIYSDLPSRPRTRTCRPCAITRAREQRAKAKAS